MDETYLKGTYKGIQDVMYDNLYNMSYLLNDLAGKIVDKNAKFIIRNLQVSPDGTLPAFPSSLVVTEYDSLLGQDEYTPELSDYAYIVFNELLARNSKRIKPTSYFRDEILSSLFAYSSNLPPVVSSYVSYAYLEMYALFIALTEHKSGEIFKYTTDEMDVVSKNLRRISLDIGLLGNDESVYRLLNVLKSIQRAILFVRTSIKSVLR